MRVHSRTPSRSRAWRCSCGDAFVRGQDLPSWDSVTLLRGLTHGPSRRTGPPWTTRSASHPYDRGTGATGAPRTVRLRRCGLNRSRDVAAARSSLSPAPGNPRPPGFRSTRRVKRSLSAASAAVSPQAFQDLKGCPSTSRAEENMRRDLSATADRPSLRHLVPEPPALFG